MSACAEPVVQILPPTDCPPGVFRETLGDRLQRVALGTAWALQPKRIGALPGLAQAWLHDFVVAPPGLPDPTRTFNDFGVCGMAHDFSPASVRAAYQQGLFAFAHFGPLKWISPSERCVLAFPDFHNGKTVRRLLRQGRYQVSFDRDFAGVLRACAGRRKGRWHVTWITPRVMQVFHALFEAGDAHSFEVWNEAGALVGGGYGLAQNGVFFTESQFSHEPNTSKLGFAALNWHLARWGFLLNDGKWPTPTISEMGFRNISRADFRDTLVRGAAVDPRRGRWKVETELKTVAAWDPGAGGAKAHAAPAA